jgi:hypothetical protein
MLWQLPSLFPSAPACSQKYDGSTQALPVPFAPRLAQVLGGYPNVPSRHGQP